MAIDKPSSVTELFPGWNLDGGPAPKETGGANDLFPWVDYGYKAPVIDSPETVDDLFGTGYVKDQLEWEFDRDPIPNSAKELFPFVDFAYQGNPTRDKKKATALFDQKAMNKLNDQNTPMVQLPAGYRNTYTSFSGADITVSIIPKGSNAKPVTLGELQTISYSIYREKKPVYALGTMKPKGFVRGPRMVAGSMIFTVFDRHVLQHAFQEAYKEKGKLSCIDNSLPDDFPPFDIQINFLNEYGQSAMMRIYGVQLVSEGQTMSIEDMMTENTVQYMAEDIQLMQADVYEKTEYGYSRYNGKKKK